MQLFNNIITLFNPYENNSQQNIGQHHILHDL